jgi:hypothetical protein
MNCGVLQAQISFSRTLWARALVKVSLPYDVFKRRGGFNFSSGPGSKNVIDNFKVLPIGLRESDRNFQICAVFILHAKS